VDGGGGGSGDGDGDGGGGESEQRCVVGCGLVNRAVEMETEPLVSSLGALTEPDD